MVSQDVAAQDSLTDPSVTKQGVISCVGPGVRKFQNWKCKEWEYREETQRLSPGISKI